MRSLTSSVVLILFLGTVVSKDLYHFIDHGKETVCSEHNNHDKHFHEIDKCFICDHIFSAGTDATPVFLPACEFSFVATTLPFNGIPPFALHAAPVGTRGPPPLA